MSSKNEEAGWDELGNDHEAADLSDLKNSLCCIVGLCTYINIYIYIYIYIYTYMSKTTRDTSGQRIG